MQTLTLKREPSTDAGTLGTINFNGTIFNTGELPWKNNESNLSCIPTGSYTCTYGFSDHLQRNIYNIQGTGNRVGCEIHNGNYCGNVNKINPITGTNYLSNVLGCIILGFSKGMLSGQMAVLNSVEALTKFESMLNNDTFQLTIVNAQV